ncbi:MAG: T9SS type A sorting domain-containing protein [Lewinellaceae bacterium]|nr:T9SS type A sorting domain-containing protein [Lewinellaceae bacterium]
MKKAVEAVLHWGAKPAQTLEVFNIQGQPLARYTLDPEARQYRLPLNQFSSGIYLLRLTLVNGKTLTARLVK